MSRNVAVTGDHLDLASALWTAPPAAVGIWVNTTVTQNRRYIACGASVNDCYELGQDSVSASGKASVRTLHGGTISENKTNTAFTANTWQLVLGSWSGVSPGITETVWAYGDKKSGGSVTAPTVTPNHFQISGRLGDHTAPLGGGAAHAMAFSAVPTDIEAAFLGVNSTGGGNYRYLRSIAHAWRIDQASGTEPDLIGSADLTVTGTSSFATNPDVGSFWTAAALATQAWTQGVAITSIDFATKFEDVHSPYTVTVVQRGTPSQVTTTSSATGTNPRVVTVNDASTFTAGDYLAIGAGAPTLALYRSSNTLLVDKDQSYNSSDAVNRYPVTTKTFTGLSITSNALAGTPAAGDVGSYALIPRATCNNNSAVFADGPVFAATVASSAATPSFSAGPVLTSTQTDGHTFSATANQTATCWLGYYVRGSATPTAAQVIAGTGTGVIAHFSAALTSGVAGSVTGTGLTQPIADAYLCLTNGNGNSAVFASTSLLKNPPSGKQYAVLTLKPISAITKANPMRVTGTGHGRTTGQYIELGGVGGMVEAEGLASTVTVVDANNFTLDGVDSTAFTTYTSGGYHTFGQSPWPGSTTIPATGDVMVCDATDPQGAPVTLRADGVVVYSTNSTLRQSVTLDLYDVSANGFLGAVLNYMNDQAPIAPPYSGALTPIFIPLNQTYSQALPALLGITDPQGDTLTATAQSALPSGFTVSANALSGAGASNSVSIVTFRFANQSQEYIDVPVNVIVGKLSIPTLIGNDFATGQNLATASYFQIVQSGSQDDPNPTGPAAAGTIIAQFPAANQPADPGVTTISVTLSTGNAPPIIPVTPPDTVVKSPTIQYEESAITVNNYRTDEAFGSVAMGPTDSPGQVYRLCRISAAARVTDLEEAHDPNPGGLYCIGVRLPNDGNPVVTGSDSIFLAALSTGSARPNWTPVFAPQVAGGSPSLANVGKRVWELLGLLSDPSPATKDLYYDVVVIAINPGTSGGRMNVRLSGRLITSLRTP